MISTTSLIGFFLASAAFSTLITGVLVRGDFNFGKDSPDLLRKGHDKAIPRLGGLPIFLSLALGAAFLLATGKISLAEWWPLLLCNALMFGVGFADDLSPVGAKVKLIGQLGVALIAYALGLSVEVLSIPIGDGNVHLGALSLPMTIFWFVAITNIINLIDGMDGLASGMGFFLCLCLIVVGFLAGQTGVVLLAVIAGGALLGFLLFNLPPASIFLGDGGAYLLGFFIASLSMQSSNKGTIAAALLVVIIALGLPILDTAFAIIRRGIRGIPLFKADAEHIHHRLLGMGYSKHSALLVMYAACAALAAIGLSVFLSRGFTLPIAGAAIVIFTLFTARYLGYVSDWSKFKQQVKNAIKRRQDVQYATLHGHLLEAEIERSTTAVEFWRHFADTMERLHMQNNPRGGFDAIDLPYNHGRAFWRFYSPVGEKTPQDWMAIAECILPAYLGGLKKWPGSCPFADLRSETTSGSGDKQSSNNVC
jgi:UDP-GlcNAc:undecaprenyl-phosphate GlcNAc-1-phosphate transferase